MNFIKNIIKLTVFLTLLTLCNVLKAQTDDKIRAIWIYNVSQYITWLNEDSISNYEIGVYGISRSIFTEVNTLAATRFIKDKPTKAVFIKKLKDIEETTFHIVFVCNDKIEEVEKIYELLEGRNILMITDRDINTSNTMINILPLNEGSKRFEVNEQNLIKHNFVVAKELLYHGGSETELKGLYSITEKELEAKRVALEEQKQVLTEQQQEIERQKEDLVRQMEENEKQKKDIEKQQVLIDTQGEKIEGQKEELNLLVANLEQQQSKLRDNLKILQDQESLIKDKQAEAEVKAAELTVKQDELKTLESEIQNAKSTLTQANEQIETQKYQLYFALAFILLVVTFFIIAFRGYRINKKINSELQKKNAEINRQKDEISNQAHQLEVTNVELEKLSIVASRTQNAVTIMDKNGNFEWVNAGFTRMYGYTLQLITHEKDDNIKNVSASPEIAKIIDSCISNKKNVVYEAENTTRDGVKLWVQTTLTPIMNEENEIVRLVAIDSDISEIKKAEQEIRQQHKMIVEQSKLLEDSNRELEKLSIVASETDNAVLIMDSQGNFEWVNEAYTRMFGYTFDQLTEDISKNIVGHKTNEETKKLIKECIDKKKTVTYQFQTKTKKGNNIWVQTTLTPIIGKNGMVKKLIAIDSEITKLKEAETEIKEKNEELEMQKEKIELQNLQIHSSIRYAQTIQKAILPIEEQMIQHFDSFVIFLPKDIVSGDFYWFAKVENSNKVFVAAVDCTGHGVPGAFMSLIGSRLLNEIINEKNIHSPEEILELVNEGVKKALKQQFTDNNDGMDLCLCSIVNLDNGKNEVIFCGAKRPLFYYKSDEKTIYQTKGDRKSIGGIRSKRNISLFVNQKILFNSGDILYLTTDGFIDQNNPARQRLGTPEFVRILNQIADKPLDYQKQELERHLFVHMKDAEQRDDITVFGIKLR